MPTAKETPELLAKLKKALTYYPGTGAILRANAKPAFITVNRNSHSGYWVGTVCGVRLYAHRTAWALHHGDWAEGEIDHINGNGLDNRIDNLRDVSRLVNRQNAKLHKDNTSGVSGVCWAKNTGKWQAQIKVRTKMVYLGQFPDKTDAVAARREAERLYGFHPNHGRVVSDLTPDIFD